MPLARITRTSLSVGLVAFAVGLGMLSSSPTDARQANRQQRSDAMPGMPRNTPPGNVVCWTPMRPARIHRHGRGSRPLHPFADSARCKRLLRWGREIGRESAQLTEFSPEGPSGGCFP
jgi:hypothetical protein